MKKAAKIIAIVILCIWALSATGLFLLAREANNEKYEELQRLQAEYDDLKEAYEKVDIATIRGIAYELLFDTVYYQGTLGEEYNLNAKIDAAVEQYELNDFEEAELIAMLSALIERYDIEG